MVIYVKICNFAVATGLSVVNRRPADAITEGSCSPARLAALRRTGLRIIGVLRTPAGVRRARGWKPRLLREMGLVCGSGVPVSIGAGCRREPTGYVLYVR